MATFSHEPSDNTTWDDRGEDVSDDAEYFAQRDAAREAEDAEIARRLQVIAEMQAAEAARVQGGGEEKP